MIEIVIETDNGVFPSARTAAEVVTILRNVANRIEEADDINTAINIQDVNGGFCGYYMVTEG